MRRGRDRIFHDSGVHVGGGGSGASGIGAWRARAWRWGWRSPRDEGWRSSFFPPSPPPLFPWSGSNAARRAGWSGCKPNHGGRSAEMLRAVRAGGCDSGASLATGGAGMSGGNACAHAGAGLRDMRALARLGGGSGWLSARAVSGPPCAGAAGAAAGREGRRDGGTAAGAAWWCMALMWSLWPAPGCYSDELLSTDVMPVRRIMMPGSAAPVIHINCC